MARDPTPRRYIDAIKRQKKKQHFHVPQKLRKTHEVFFAFLTLVRDLTRDSAKLARLILEKFPKTVISSIFALLAFLGFLQYSSATIAKSYPAFCLGGWENPKNAEGEPSLGENADLRDFNEGNSSILRGVASQIFCGDFRGEIPEDTMPKKVKLKFSWFIGEKPASADGSDVAKEVGGGELNVENLDATSTTLVITEDDLASSTNAILDAPLGTAITVVDELPATSTEEDTLHPLPASPSKEGEGRPNSESPAPLFRGGLPEGRSGSNEVGGGSKEEESPGQRGSETEKKEEPKQEENHKKEEKETEVAPAPETPKEETPPPAENTPAPETPAPTEPPPAENPVTSFFQKIFHSVFAAEEENEKSEEIVVASTDSTSSPQASEAVEEEVKKEKEIKMEETKKEEIPQEETATTSETITTATSSPDNSTSTDQLPVSSEQSQDFLEILYTLDGSEWQSLGKVSKSNWQNAEFEMPVLPWADLSKIQISIQSLPALDSVPPVYLDGMWLEVEYEELAKEEAPGGDPEGTISSAASVSGPVSFFSTETVGASQIYTLTLDNPDETPDYKYQFLDRGVRLLMEREEGKWEELLSEVRPEPEYQQGGKWKPYNLKSARSEAGGWKKETSADGTVRMTRELETEEEGVSETFTETWDIPQSAGDLGNNGPKATYKMTKNRGASSAPWRMKLAYEGIPDIKADHDDIRDEDGYPVRRREYGDFMIDVNDFDNAEAKDGKAKHTFSEKRVGNLSASGGKAEALFFPEGTTGERIVDPTTVTVGAAAGWGHNKQRTVFYDGTRFWLLYYGAGNIYYKSSTDNVTWTATSTLVNDVNTTDTEFDTYMVNDTKFDLVYEEATTADTNAVTVTISGSTLTAGAKGADANATNCDNVSIARTPSADRIFVTCRNGVELEVWSADQTGDANNITTWTGEITTAEGNLANQVTMAPYGSSDKVLVLYQRDSTNANDCIWSRAITRAGGAGTAVCLNAGAGTQFAANTFGNAVRISDTNFKFIMQATAGTTGLSEYTWNDSTWSQTVIDTETDEVNPSLFYDSVTGDLYAFAIDTGNTPDSVDRYKKPSGGAWETEVAADDAEATDRSLSVTQMESVPYGSSRTSPRHLVWGYRVANGSAFDLKVGSLQLHHALTQKDYRWYTNANSVQPGSALQVENTAHTLISVSSPIRLRMNVSVAAGTLAASSTEFSLQYAYSTNGPWTNVNDWWNTSWQNRKKISLNNASATTDLENFAVPVQLRSTANGVSGAIDYSKTRDLGQDIRFVDANGTTTLAYEIEKWDETATSTVWVKVPKINQATTTDYIWMYYNNTSASDAQSATSVWETAAKGVWHMGNNASTTDGFTDSTLNANHGDGSGGSSLASTTAKIDGGYSFDGVNDYVTAGSDPGLDITSGTLSFWFQTTQTSVNVRGLAAKDLSGGNLGDLGVYIVESDDATNPNKIVFFSNNGNPSANILVVSDSTVTLGQWTHVAAIFGSGGMKLYINGSLQADTDTNTVGMENASASFVMGSLFANAGPFDGLIDDVRIYNRVFTADEILAQYKAGAGTFTTYGSEESAGTNAWLFYNGNSSAADGANITSTILSASDIKQTYESANFTATTTQYAVTVGQEGEWDFALDPTNATSTTYYFRMVDAKGNVAFSSYTNYPTLSVSTDSLTLTVSTDVFGTLTPGTHKFATSTLNVTTSNSTGWNVTIYGNNQGSGSASTTLYLSPTTYTTTIADGTEWIPGSATTSAGNATSITAGDDFLYFRVMTASGSAPFRASTWWGSADGYPGGGTTLWAGIASTTASNKQIGNSSISATNALSTVQYYLDVPATQVQGSYTGDVTFTATVNP